MRVLLILVLSGVVFVGCHHAKPPQDSATSFQPKKAKMDKAPARQTAAEPVKSPEPLPRVSPLNEFSGKVASVSAELRFVVLDFHLTQLPPVDQRLGVFRQGQKVGEVKITGPSRDQNIVADLTAGEAQTGDEVHGN
jgi:hypothetical protein